MCSSHRPEEGADSADPAECGLVPMGDTMSNPTFPESWPERSLNEPMSAMKGEPMPRTEAGRRLLAEYDDPEAPIYPVSVEAILAIEREAAAPSAPVTPKVPGDPSIDGTDFGHDPVTPRNEAAYRLQGLLDWERNELLDAALATEALAQAKRYRDAFVATDNDRGGFLPWITHEIELLEASALRKAQERRQEDKDRA